MGRSRGGRKTSLARWRERIVADGRDGLRDRSRAGRPPKLDVAARGLQAEALESAPGAYGYLVATRTFADMTYLLVRLGWTVSPVAVHRTVHALGSVHPRPRHDLRRCLDAEAVASAQRVLTDLQKGG